MTDIGKYTGGYDFHDLSADFRAYADLMDRPENDAASGFDAVAIWVIRHMADKYEDQAEAFYKSERFMMISNYLAQNISNFDIGDFAVFGSDAVGALLSNHLVRAVHHLFVETEAGHELGYNPSPENVMQLADSFRDHPTVG